MAKYRVTTQRMELKTFIIEAESQDEAEELAVEASYYPADYPQAERDNEDVDFEGEWEVSDLRSTVIIED